MLCSRNNPRFAPFLGSLLILLRREPKGDGSFSLIFSDTLPFGTRCTSSRQGPADGLSGGPPQEGCTLRAGGLKEVKGWGLDCELGG